MPEPRPPGAILAGGASRRLSGPAQASKAFATLGDRELVQHVIDRLAPQVDRLWLVLAPDAEAPNIDGVDFLSDEGSPGRGPLAGLGAALARLEATGGQWLVLAPCDTPFLPRDLVDRLLAGADQDTLAVVAEDASRVHPTCSAWRVQALPAVRAALADPRAPGLMGLLDDLPHGRVRWSDIEPPPFLNVNAPDDLERAARWLEPRS